MTSRAAGASEEEGGLFERVWAIVAAVPEGRVVTYGQISAALDRRLSPAAVGWALARCPDGIPWQRVVNASGRCSTDRGAGKSSRRQQRLLESEGVRFDRSGGLDLQIYRHLLS